MKLQGGNVQLAVLLDKSVDARLTMAGMWSFGSADAAGSHTPGD